MRWREMADMVGCRENVILSVPCEDQCGGISGMQFKQRKEITRDELIEVTCKGLNIGILPSNPSF